MIGFSLIRISCCVDVIVNEIVGDLVGIVFTETIVGCHVNVTDMADEIVDDVAAGVTDKATADISCLLLLMNFLMIVVLELLILTKRLKIYLNI